MNYFLNYNLGIKLTGIEHAAISRLKCFNYVGLEAKILTVYYNTELSDNANLHQVDNIDIINMYHFFQKAKNVNRYSINDLSETSNLIFKKVDDANDYRVYDDNDKYLMYVSCFTNTDYISYINYFDNERNKYKRVTFDSLGFKSKLSFLNNDMSLRNELFFDVFGNVVLEHKYQYINGNNTVVFIVLNYDKKDFYFSTIDDLVLFWLKILVDTDDKVCFFVDRSYFFNRIIKKINSENLKKICVIHSLHVNDTSAIDTAEISEGYDYALKYSDDFHKIIVSTTEQFNDIKFRFPQIDNICVIPPTYTISRKINSCNNESIKLISLGRYYYEKRLDHMLKAMLIVKDICPNITLDLYGFSDSRNGHKTFNELIDFVKSNNLENNVFFKGYCRDKELVLIDYDVALVTSLLEGFCMAILETMNYGIPNITYDIKYGPKELINNNINGFIVENKNIEDLAEKIIFFEKNRLELNIFSKNSYNKSLKFSLSEVANKWQKILN